MGVLKKYIRAYLFAYGVFGVVSLIMFGVLIVLGKLIDSHSDVIGGVIIILGCLCFWGVPLCYAFPEFKRKIKPALVRIIILNLLFCLLFFVFLCFFVWLVWFVGLLILDLLCL